MNKTSKTDARRRVREAQAKANEHRAQRERDNAEDAATILVAVGNIEEVDAWEARRLAAVSAEADKRRAGSRNIAGAGIAKMKARGENLTSIAALTNIGVGELRAMLRYAPKPANAAPALAVAQESQPLGDGRGEVVSDADAVVGGSTYGEARENRGSASG